MDKNIEFNKILNEKLDLDSEPVAIKFFNNLDEIPDGIEKIPDKKRHCEMVRDASYGKKFYASSNEQACKGGSAALGLEDFPEKLKSGETYYKLGRFKDLETSKRTVDSLSVIKDKHLGIIYAPLKEAEFVPDIIVILTSPVVGMKIAQSIVYSSGEKVSPSFAGIQSICGDVVSGPYMTGKTNMSLGCSGSRKYADIKDNELAI